MSRLATEPQDDNRRLDVFSPIKLRKVADEVVSVLVDAIRGGVFEPGDMLPRERDLAARLEVSRATVRESVGILERAGIVSVRRGNTGGIMVVTRSIPAAVLTAIEGKTHEDIRALLEARRMLELSSALLAGEHGNEEDFDELRRLVAKLDELTTEPDEAAVVDLQFHFKVARISQNSILEEYLRITLHRLTAFRAQFGEERPSGYFDVSRRLHRETLEALESRDPQQIAKAIDDHLGNLEEHFLGERLPFVSLNDGSSHLPS